MFINERQKQILDITTAKKNVSVEELAKLVYASEATIRRDLSNLELHGLIRRIWGGASVIDTSSGEMSSYFRQQSNTQEKRRMGNACVEYLQNDGSYFFDSSTTVGHIIPHLKKLKGGVAITNGLYNANALSAIPNIKSLVIGGEIQTATGAAIGASTIEQLSQYYCDVCFFSCHGLSLNGPTEGSVEQQKAKALMVKNSKLRVCLVDHQKFGKTYFVKTCSFEEIDVLITDQKPDDEFMNVLSEHNVKLVIV